MRGGLGLKNKKKILEARSLRNYDKAKFLNDIKEVNWELVLSPFSGTPNLMINSTRFLMAY